MKWQLDARKRVLKGLIYVILPFTVLFFILEKAFLVMRSLISPMKELLPADSYFGIGVLSILSALLLLALCFVAGLMAERKYIQSMLGYIEEKFLVYFPGYTMLKSSATEAIGNSDNHWKVVLLGTGSEKKLGIEIERNSEGQCVVFCPEPPDAKSGDLLWVDQSQITPTDMPVSKLLHIVRNYGKGTSNGVYKSDAASA